MNQKEAALPMPPEVSGAEHSPGPLAAHVGTARHIVLFPDASQKGPHIPVYLHVTVQV